MSTLLEHCRLNSGEKYKQRTRLSCASPECWRKDGRVCDLAKKVDIFNVPLDEEVQITVFVGALLFHGSGSYISAALLAPALLFTCTEACSLAGSTSLPLVSLTIVPGGFACNWKTDDGVDSDDGKKGSCKYGEELHGSLVNPVNGLLESQCN